jgi:lipoprotein-anchoring transpeptidase ErfK/SrfK
MTFSDDINTYKYQARNAVTGDHTPIELGFHADDIQPHQIAQNPSYGPGDYTYIDTGHPAGKDIHGGGNCSAVSDPYADGQGWCPTFGCIRMQNKDIRDLSQKILQYKNSNPGSTVPFDVVRR